MAEHRVSNVVYILARLDIDGEDFLLFYTHPKWGDWSLVGGHVEADEESRWSAAATREAAEELAPLVPGRDFELLPLPQGPEQWGPEASKSAGGAPTVYCARWYALRFLTDPVRQLSTLEPNDYLLVERGRVERGAEADLTTLVSRFVSGVPAGLDAVPYGWPERLHRNDIGVPTRAAAS